MARAADHLTLQEIDEQYGKIRGAALQSWVTMLIGCGFGVAFLGMPAVFGALAVLHTAGLPFVLAFVRRWRDGLVARERR